MQTLPSLSATEVVVRKFSSHVMELLGQAQGFPYMVCEFTDFPNPARE